MGFGNFIRGIVAQVNPFDHGATYGTYNPPKKKPQPGDPGYNAPTPQAPNPSQQANQGTALQTQRPDNLFAGLNNNLKLPGSPPNNVPVVHAPNLTSIMPAQPPQPGTVVKPINPPQPTPIVTGQNITHIGQLTPGSQQIINAHSKQYTPQNQPGYFKAVDTGADITANVASGFGEGLSRLAGAPLSLASLIARKTGNHGLADTIDSINAPSKIGNSIASARKEVDVAAQNEGVNTPYQIGSRVGSVALAVPAAAEGISKLGQVPNIIQNLPKTAAVLRTIGKLGGGEILPKVRQFFRGNPAEDNVTAAAGAGEAGNVTQIPVTNGSPGSTPIPVNRPNPIPIHDVSGLELPPNRMPPGVEPSPTPVTPAPLPPPIRELAGDIPGAAPMPTSNEVAAQRARSAFDNQVPGRPDSRIEGVGNPVTSKDLGDAKAALDDYLKTGKISEADHADLTKQLENIKPTDASVPKGAKIEVRQVNTLPVQDRTNVPQNLPETPGTVRATTATAPSNAKSEAVAAQTPVAPPIPKAGTVLPDGTTVTKRMVQAARNNAKNAKKVAKAQEDIAAASSRADAAKPTPPESAGFVPTGEFRQGANGNVSEVAHQSTEAAQGAADTATLNSGDVIAKANQEVAQNGLVSPESVRNLQAMLESGRFSQTSPEYRAMAKTLYGAGSQHGRGLSLFNPTMRRTASGDQLANRFVSKLYGVTEDGSKLTDSHIASVSQADNTFAAARDAANQALDRYNATKSATDFTAWKQARQAADDAEKHSLITEYRVANEVLKGNKDPAALKAVQDAEKKAGVYQMDWVDSSMLSGTGTMARNATNTSLVRLENAIFGRLPGGGRYSGKGAKIGSKVGNRSIATDFRARNELDQNKLSKAVKQWTTTGNMLSEGNLNAVGSARAYRFYEKQLKTEGVTGDQLARDTEVRLHADPQGMAQHYQEWALSENALAGLTHSKKIEQSMVDAIASKGGGKLSQTAAKAAVRLTVGFPTVIGRSLYGGVKRATLIPDVVGAARAWSFGKGAGTQELADALYSLKVHAGSGATLYGLGYALSEAGLISPSYPKDPAEQARWKAEGIQPNSIKIGGQWFGIPGYFGALALPLIIPANIQGKSNPADVAKGIVSGLQDLSPTTGLINFVDGMEGRSGKQWVKNEVSSLTRAVTPVGSLLNEIAKMTDPTKNDTTTKDAIHNILDSIAGGIPGVNNAVNKIPATDNNGNELHNPNPAATFFGAQGSVQPQGQQDVQQAQSVANDTYKQLNDYGVLKDKTLMGLVDKKLQAQIGRGEKLTPEELAKVQKSVTKGVGDNGEDTAYLEKGQYDTNIAALKVKHDLLAADPTTKPSSLKNLDTAIKRGGVYKDNKIPYDLINAYKTTSAGDWHKMGIPPGDKNYDPDLYDPEMYQKLWNLDQLMTKNGVSYRKDHLDKNKYSDPNANKASGAGKEPKQLDTSFGTLKAGNSAPTVQQYASIAAKAGTIPHIAVQRPNIVHKISVSGGI